MRKMRMGSLVIAVALGATLAACGGSGTGGGDGGAPSKTVSADQYASGVCKSVSGWLQGLATESQQLVATLSSGAAPEQGKQALVTFLGGAAQRTHSLIADVEEVGAPDVSGGDQAASDLLDGLRQTEQSFTSAQKKARDLPTDSQTSFQQGAQEISATLQKETSGIQSSMDVTQKSQELKSAFRQAPQCRKTFGPPRTAPSPRP
jgi:GMP synthase-like glutamine amidotransferase